MHSTEQQHMVGEGKRPSTLIMVFTGMLVTMVVVMFARLSYGIILPFMRESLGLSYRQAGYLGTACALGYLCLVMAAGVFAARHGARLSIMIGLLLTTTGFTGLTQFSDYRLLLLLMVALGFGTAFAYTPLVSLLSSWFPERRGSIIGMANSGVGIGMLLSGAMVPWLQMRYGAAGWRISWGIYGVASVVTATMAWVCLKNPPARTAAGTRIDARDKLTVYRNPQVITVGCLYAMVAIIYMVQGIFMVSFALDSGISPVTAGRLTSLTGVLSILSSPAWGRLLDRFGRFAALAGSVSMTAIGMIVPVVWPTLPGFIIHYFIMGCTVSGLFTSVLVASAESVPPRLAPLAVSYVTFFYAVGQLIGPAAGGLLIEQAGGFRSTFAACGAVLGTSLLLCLRLRKPSVQAAKAASSP